MAEPRIARSLDRLRAQVRAAVPNGPPLSEYGWIGDEAHQNRVSDHNPDELGIVRALDIPHAPGVGLDTYELANHLRDVADTRIKYLISNRRIWNPAISKAWRVYNGADAHDHHMHVSVVADSRADDPRDWDLGDVLTAEPAVSDLRPLVKRGMTGNDVRLVQQALMVDGIFGALTQEAVRKFQAQEALDDDGIVGPLTWRALEYRYPQLIAPALPSSPAPQIEHPWQTDITATVFGGPNDQQRSAYDNHVIGVDEYGAALPYRFSGEPPILQIWNRANNKAVLAEIVDVGPWNIDDPYWQSGARPQAESGTDKKGRKTNLAGIDLSLATANALGISGKGKVWWRFT